MYVKADRLDAEGLTKYILDTLDEYHLDPSYIVSQGYDGASIMSGQLSGVQARIKSIVPSAVYIHCSAHCLNLCLVDCVKSVQHAGEFFALLESLYVFLSSSKWHVLYTEHQQKLYPDKQVRRLQRLSDTRWACRASVVATLCYTFEAVLATLVDFINGNNDGARVSEARGILLQLKSARFLVCLVTFDQVLSLTKGLSDVLQSTSLDLAKAANLVSATIESVQELRSDTQWQRVFAHLERIATHYGIDMTPISVARRVRHPPSRLEADFVVMSTTGVRNTSSSSRCISDEYKINFYYCIIDAVLFELNRRFDKKNQDIMLSLQACSPGSSNSLDITVLQPFIDIYNLNSEELMIEIPLVKRVLSKESDLQDLSDVLLELVPLRSAFPNVVKLFQIGMTISVSTAKCERTFSTLKRIKSFLRTTMSEERLTNLAILSIERDLSDSMDFEQVVEHFAKKDHRIVLH